MSVSSDMSPDDLIESSLTESVIGAFFEVYNTLGYGFLEALYIRALHQELESRGHRVAREVLSRASYKGHVIGLQRMDMVVDEKLVVEVKSSAQLHPIAMRQLLNYLRATDLEVGLLLHFGPEPKHYRRVLSQEVRSSKSGRANQEANT